MENIGPVVLFLLYMVISAWAKQRKRRMTNSEKTESPADQKESAWQPRSKVQSIFDQIKKELFEEAEPELPPLEFQEFESQLDEVMEGPEEVQAGPVFVEGERAIHADVTSKKAKLDSFYDEDRDTSLSGILKSYNTIQQGILLREILGKPRAMQDKSEWFHNG